MAKEQKESKVKVHHIMADGTERDSIEGLVVPYEQCPEVYHILAQMSLKRAEKARKEKQTQQDNSCKNYTNQKTPSYKAISDIIVI